MQIMNHFLFIQITHEKKYVCIQNKENPLMKNK
jgi:hypothetical protein